MRGVLGCVLLLVALANAKSLHGKLYFYILSVLFVGHEEIFFEKNKVTSNAALGYFIVDISFN